MTRRPSALNALIAIDKPAGMTSHDVVSRVRRAVGEKRVGHAGTLDPDATGVLVVGIGQATKLLGLITLDRKGYRATFALGAETTTDDAAGEVTATAEVPSELLDPARAAAELSAIEGPCDQVPPAFSAVSVGGKRAYAMARAGEKVELEPRHVTIYGARLVEVRPEERAWVVDLDVSKGTYVRSIARDLGRSLGCLAHVCELRRTFSGPVSLEDCVSLEELAEGGADLVRRRALDPVAVLGLPVRELALDEVTDVMNGRALSLGHVRRGSAPAAHVDPDDRVALVFGGALAGIWRASGRSLRCVSNFPQAIEGVCDPLDLGTVSPEAPLGARRARRLVRASVPAEPGACEVRQVSAAGGCAEGRLVVPAGSGEPGGSTPVVCAIGAFDGVHLGHQALLARARREALRLGGALVAVTFDPDPARVLAPQGSHEDLLVPRDRELALMGAGVDALLVLSFTPELAALSHERFVTDVLGGLFDVRSLVVGADFRLGAGGAGTVSALTELGRRAGFGVIGMELADEGGAPVTSTRIRGLLAEGKVEGAQALLGRCHFVRGRVERGRGEGTGFGFPTANVRVTGGVCMPAEGVYAGHVVVRDENRGQVAWPAAINVGKPRTFSPGEEGQAFLEATLLGFAGDLYGQVVEVVFARWLRAPRTFPSLEELERVVLSNVDWVRNTLGEEGIEVSGRRL